MSSISPFPEWAHESKSDAGWSEQTCYKRLITGIPSIVSDLWLRDLRSRLQQETRDDRRHYSFRFQGINRSLGE